MCCFIRIPFKNVIHPVYCICFIIILFQCMNWFFFINISTDVHVRFCLPSLSSVSKRKKIIICVVGIWVRSFEMQIHNLFSSGTRSIRMVFWLQMPSSSMMLYVTELCLLFFFLSKYFKKAPGHYYSSVAPKLRPSILMATLFNDTLTQCHWLRNTGQSFTKFSFVVTLNKINIPFHAPPPPKKQPIC